MIGNEPSYPRIEAVEQGNPWANIVRSTDGMTIRQKAVLMAPSAEIVELLPTDADEVCTMAGVTIEEYKADSIGVTMRIIAVLRCRWADACLAEEARTREEGDE